MNRNTNFLLVLAFACAIVASAAETARSSAITLDTQSLGTEITIQPDTELTYSLNWGATPAVKALITADGVAKTETESVVDYEVFAGFDTGNLNTFTWDYASVSPAVLPRGSYTLSHTTLDDKKVEVDTFTCNVKLLPEPCAISALLLALLALAKRR